MARYVEVMSELSYHTKSDNMPVATLPRVCKTLNVCSNFGGSVTAYACWSDRMVVRYTGISSTHCPIVCFQTVVACVSL